MRDVRSLPPAEVAIASILAAGLWALQTRSWRPAGIAHEDGQAQIDKPSIVYWRDHSAGASRRRVTPMPRGSRPSMAALTSSGARNSSEIVILTCRMLHFSRAAICSTLVMVPATISSSQRRPRAIDATSVARVSARMGSNIVWRHRYRHDDLAPSLRRRLFPRDAQNESIIVHRIARVAGCFLGLELNRQLVCLQFDSHDVVADEASVITFCAIPEMLADGACDARLDLGRRHPANRSGTRGLPVEEG